MVATANRGGSGPNSSSGPITRVILSGDPIASIVHSVPKPRFYISGFNTIDQDIQK